MSSAEPTATDRVYESLYSAVLDGTLTPATRLREEELATRFAVSRTVIRQALQRLAQEGLVELQHNRGAQVIEPSRELAAHVFDARRVIECEVARRLGGRLTEAQLQSLQALLTREAQADARGDRPTAIRLSGEFHRALAQLSGNPVFLRVIDELLPTTSLLLALYPPQHGCGCAAHRHEDLVAALRQGGPAAAAEMKRHLAEIERSLQPAPPGPAARADAASATNPRSPVRPRPPARKRRVTAA